MTKANWLERRRELAKLQREAGPSAYEDRPPPELEPEWTPIGELGPSGEFIPTPPGQRSWVPLDVLLRDRAR